MWGPDIFTMFVNDLVLVQVMVGSGAEWGSKEVWEKLGFWEDGEREDAMGRSRWGGRRDSGNRGSNDRQWKVLNWDIGKWDVLNNFFKTLVDMGVLQLRVRVLKLGNNDVVLLGGNVSENLEEVGQGGDKGGGGGGDGDDRRQIDNEGGQEGRWADRRVREDGDGEQGRCVAVWTRVVLGVVGAIEEILNDLVGSGCYNPPTNFSFLPSGSTSTQPLVLPPQPISTAPAPAPLTQSALPSQPAPLAFSPFHTSYTPLYHVTDFYEHPQGYAQLQQPLGSPHRQPLPPSPDPNAEISSPTHASSSINHYSLLQPPSPRDVPMGTPPSDCYRLPHVTVFRTKDWLHLQCILYEGFYTSNIMYMPFVAVSENIRRIFSVTTSPLQSLLIPRL